MKIVNGIPDVLMEQHQMVALDVETFGQEERKLHRPTGTFACLSICPNEQTVYQIYDEGQIKDVLRAIKHTTWVFHNALYDLRQLGRFAKINPSRFIWDTMLVEQSMTGGLYQTYSLADLYRRWMSKPLSKDVREDFSERTSMTEEMKKYAAKDALITLQIAKMQAKEWENTTAYSKIDEPMLFPVLDMPGIPVDAKMWESMAVEFANTAKRLEEELGLNSMSRAQVISGAKGVGVHLKDTTAETLLSFANVPFIAKVLEARMYRKAESTYGMKWLERSLEDDGKVYSSWHITGAETGRMSCSDPNLQQIPARKLPQFRKAFIPSKGNRLLISDVSQQEPRILAFESKDEELIAALMAGEDLHLTVARTVFNDPKMKKDDPRRFIGKTINLGTSYGLSEYGLANRLNIKPEEAKSFLRAYFTRFRSVFSWISLQRRFASQNEYVKTAVGRKVYMNPYGGQWENNAINAPIQGGAADFTKMWTRKIWERTKSDFPVVAIVHDELVMDVPTAAVEDVKTIMTEAYQETAEELYPGIPFVVDSVVGKSWGAKGISAEAYGDDE